MGSMGTQLGARLRMVAIVNAIVLVAAVLSIGQVQFERDQKKASAAGLSEQQSIDDQIPDEPTASASASPTPGKSGKPSASPKPGETAGSDEPDTTPGYSEPGGGKKPTVKPEDIPEFGLKTQGVTKDSVTIGADYDKTGCGGAAALTNAFGKAVTGDPEKAFATYVRYINDTGGIRGRTLKAVTVDDGGLYCPERHKSAEIELVDQKKVFMDIAGLHEVSDLLAKRHIPFEGGRSSLAEQKKQGYGQFQIFQDADGDFDNWASFGKYYIASDKNMPCFVHPDTDDFNGLEPIMIAKMAKYGLKFGDIIRYADDASTAQSQATTGAVRLKKKGCKQVWLVANNALAAIFFTNAAAQQQWYPTWTWTARTALIDQKLGGSLMNQNEWKNSIGLTSRIKPGGSPFEGNCAKIWNKYNSGDGQSGSAATLVACAGVLLAAEAMRRAVDVTGVLTANSLMLGVNSIRSDFYYDSHVPLTYSIPNLKGPFDFTGYDVQTVAKWSNGQKDYVFPEWPRYWKTMGPGRSGGIDIRPAFMKQYTPPKVPGVPSVPKVPSPASLPKP